MPQKTYKWQRVTDSLLADLDAGKHPQGSCFYSIKDICGKFNVSVITARRVLDELKAGKRIRSNGRRRESVVLDPASASDGRLRAPLARQTVYLCFRTDTGQFDAATQPHHAPLLYHEVLRGFQRPPFDQMFSIRPVSIDFCLAHRNTFRNALFVVNQEVLFAGDPKRPTIDLARAESVRRYLNPIVFQAYKPIAGFTELSIDKGAGIRDAVACLVRAGHRRIGFQSLDVVHLCFQSRFQGYLKALEINGLPFNPAWIGTTPEGDVEAHQAFVAGLMASRDRPTALVCANDARALAVLAWCQSNGVRVPDDLAVTGFDNIPESELADPPLTTIDQRFAEMGAEALNLLRRRLAGDLIEPVKHVITPRLILRKSHGMISAGFDRQNVLDNKQH